MSERFCFHDLGETATWLKNQVANISDKQVLLLEGPMGVGKTQFVRLLVEAMGGTETFSPSFPIHNQYKANNLWIDHLDLFRIKNLEDLESTGFWDLFGKERGLVVIEWADRVNGLAQMIPRQWELWRLTFSFGACESERFLTVEKQPLA